MGIEITSDNIKMVRRQLEKYGTDSDKSLLKALVECGIAVKDQMVSIMRSKLKKSIPELPPRVQTGVLVNSIISEIEVNDNGVSAVVGPSGPANGYAYGLEFGTSTTWRHPFAKPALNAKQEFCRRNIEDAMRNTGKGV